MVPFWPLDRLIWVYFIAPSYEHFAANGLIGPPIDAA